MTEGWSYRLKHGGRTIDLRSDRLTLGRSRRCDVAINDPSVSRKHVFLTFHEDRIHLQDLGSSNGTFVNDERVTSEAELMNGDSLRLGDAEVAVEIRRGTFDDSSSGASPRPVNGALHLSGSTVLPTGSSVAVLAPPLGELPSSGPEDELTPPQEEPAAPRAPRKPPKPVFEAPPPRRKRPRGVAPPPDLLKLDDSLALTATSDSESETADLLPPLDEEIPEDTEPVPITREFRSSLAFAAPADFWLRAAAFLVDAFWIAAFVWLAYGVAGRVGALVVAGATVFVPWLGWGLWGTTPGKSLVGLQVVRSPELTGIGLGPSALRLVAFVLGGLVLGIGFWMAALSEDGLAFHDRLAGTRVVRRGR